MSEAKHTPGPWNVVDEPDYLTNLVIEGQRHPGNEGSKPIVAVAWEMIPDRREDKANARLIAAAPDLLSACEEMHRTLTAPSRLLLDSTRKEMKPWLPMLEAVIAKATGKEIEPCQSQK